MGTGSARLSKQRVPVVRAAFSRPCVKRAQRFQAGKAKTTGKVELLFGSRPSLCDSSKGRG